jgi:hypothetical protein
MFVCFGNTRVLRGEAFGDQPWLREDLPEGISCCVEFLEILLGFHMLPLS